MLPTIDITQIGILIVVWNGLKFIWHFLWGALTWVKEKAAAIALGSRFWATAFFLSVTLSVIALSSVVISYVVAWISSFVFSRIPDSNVISNAVRLICTIFPIRPFLDVLSTLFAGYFYLFVLENYGFWFLRMLGILKGVKSSWKT